MSAMSAETSVNVTNTVKSRDRHVVAYAEMVGGFNQARTQTQL